MGLFSFSKDAGAKPVAAVKSTVSAEEQNRQKVTAMKHAVDELHLPVHDLSLEIHEDTVTVYGQAETQVAKELVVLTLGNNMGVRTVDDRMSVVAPEPEATFYEVKSGDSLSKIAKHVYGDATKYNVIFEANKPMLKDPDRIYPGQMLRIPAL